jgi:hypothetical protein
VLVVHPLPLFHPCFVYIFQLVWVSSLTYPTCLGLKSFVVVVEWWTRYYMAGWWRCQRCYSCQIGTIFGRLKFSVWITHHHSNLLFFVWNGKSEKLNWIMGTKYRKIRLHSWYWNNAELSQEVHNFGISCANIQVQKMSLIYLVIKCTGGESPYWIYQYHLLQMLNRNNL